MKVGAKSMKTIPALNECSPGIKPSEYNVLIIPEDTEEVTAGGIILATSTKEMNDISTMRGRLVAVSPHAFSYSSDWPEGSMPEVGQAVLFAKYAGTLVKGLDGKEYRLCKDKDVAAVMDA
jgi:co-chaperonin GroES (HSP10)